MTPRQQAAHQLALWLSQQHPDLFLAAYHYAKFGASPTVTPALGDLSDMLSSIGDDVGSAVSSVGDWLGSDAGLQTLSTLAGVATTVMTTQAQQSAIQAQIARTRASQPPLAIAYTSQGSPIVPVTTTGAPVTVGTPPQSVAGYVPATQQFLAQYIPPSWDPWVIGGAVALGLFFVLRMIRG